VELEVTVAVCAPARASQHTEAKTKKRIFFMKRQLEYSNRERASGKFVRLNEAAKISVVNRRLNRRNSFETKVEIR